MGRIRAGEELALDALIQRYWRPLVQYAMGFVHQEVDGAEDIVQEAFIRVWEGRGEWKSTGSVRGYLYTVVRNLCLKERRWRGIRSDWADREQFQIRASPSPSDVLQEREVQEALGEAVQRLPDRRREVFVLGCLHGLKHREVAEAMGVAVPTVSNHMKLALDELREALRSVTDQRI